MAASGSAVLTGAIINIVTALIAFLVFCWLRIWHKAVRFYDPKRNNAEVKVKPAELPATFFGWIMPTLRFTEPDVIRSCGLDTAIYLRLLGFGTELFLYISAWALVVILPTNITGDEVDNLMSKPDSDFTFTDFDKLSLSNVPAGSPRLWVHLISVWVITFMTLRLLWRYSQDSVLLRIQFLGNSAPSGPTHSVLVTDIPAVMAATEAGSKQRAAEDKERKKAEDAEAKAAKEQKKKQEVRKEASASSQLPILNAPLVTSGPVAEGQGADGGVVSEGDVRIEVPRATAPAAARAVTATTSTTEAGAQEENLASAASGTTIPMATLSSDPEKGAVGAKDVYVPPKAGAAGLRKRQVFNYDLPMPSLDPKVTAKEQLDAGVTPLELVESEFGLVYGADQVAAVQLVYDQSGLNKLVPEYNQRKQDLGDFLDAVKYKEANNMPLEPPKVTLLFPDAWCKERYGGGIFKKVDGLPFWRDRLLWLEEQILAAQEEARRIIWPSAFVTFKTRVAQSVSATGLHEHDEQTWVARGAPEPRELIWGNLGMISAMRSSRSIIMLVLFWLLVCFYMIPITAIQGLIDVDKLAKTPGLSAFLNNVVINKLIQAIVPGLVLKIFLALLPAILAFMMTLAGAVSQSAVDLGVVSRFFIFQVVVVFLGNTLASSFFSQAEQWVNNPTSVVSVLGTAIPQACTFFITYVFVSIAGTAISFLRIVGLVLSWLFMWLAGSPRAQRRVYEEQYTTYGVSVTGHTITILFGIVFCAINPIITPSVLVYFALAALVERYNNIYVYRRTYESAGQLWPRLLNQVMTALYIFQIVMIGLLAIKKFPYTVLIAPVLVPSICFHLVTMRLFSRPWALMSLHDAAQLDVNDKIAEAEALEAGTEIARDPEQYLSPVFKVYKGDLTDVLAEAEEAARKVAEAVEKRALEAEAAKKK